MTPRFHQLRIAEVRRETPECVSLAFDLPAELADEYRYTQSRHLALRATLDGELPAEFEANVGMADAASSASEQRVKSDPAPD